MSRWEIVPVKGQEFTTPLEEDLKTCLYMFVVWSNPLSQVHVDHVPAFENETFPRVS